MNPSLIQRTNLRHLPAIMLLILTPLMATASTANRVTFGVISDVHQDIMPDGSARISAFVGAMKTNGADFIIQLGDFCWPHSRNLPFLSEWNTFPGPRYHVLGNHDMDGGYQQEKTAAFYGMPAIYYTFDAGPVRGLVLNGNEPGGKARGYKRFIGPIQLKWLQEQCESSNKPLLLFIHQPFDADGLENAKVVRGILETIQKKHPGRIIAVISGHEHMDYMRIVNGIRYIHINSASDWWLASSSAHRETFPHEVHVTHPHLKCVAAYRDPLWATVTIDLERNTFTVEGRKSSWIGPDPWQRGESKSIKPDQVHPYISDFHGEAIPHHLPSDEHPSLSPGTTRP